MTVGGRELSELLDDPRAVSGIDVLVDGALAQANAAAGGAP
ncbi:MAG: hypothetical protein WD271_16085 [Acidimicrobiia bacterium]